jgi:tRNA-splicing ligase RtcB
VNTLAPAARIAHREPETRVEPIRLGVAGLELAVAATLCEISRLPFVRSVLALPDLHQKKDMEVPSSLAVTTRGVIVPEFTSVAVNDGMGVVTTPLRADEMNAERLSRFFTHVNENAARNFFDANRYSLGAHELKSVVTQGGRAVLGKYGHDASVLERMEDGGVSTDAELLRSLDEVVPLQLRHTSFPRCEMGLNFGGNHFLEVQVVDEILDPEVGKAWGFTRGQVVVMYHLGPGPFGGTLLHHYSRREKLYGRRIPLYVASKLLFHYGQRLGRGDVRKKWALHFRRNRWTPLPESSEEGLLFRRALAMAMNFGYAYRLATLRAIQDGLREAIAPDVSGSLFCDIAHNGIFREPFEGEPMWVARHNACRLQPGRPTIVAGSYDVPSYLGIGLDGLGGRHTSYDHGAGTLIEAQRRSGQLQAVPGSVLKHVMKRGKSGGLVAKEERSLRSTETIDGLLACLERERVSRPVIRLKPLGNLKN